MNEGMIGIAGVIIGFLAATMKEWYERNEKRKRFELAIKIELEEAVDQIMDKMRWLEREKTPNDPAGIVSVDGRQMYLGEKEKFQVATPFWNNNYSEIVAVTSTEAYKQFSKAFKLLRKFESKFADMKLSFECHTGDPKTMAAAVYKDLKKIQTDLQNLVPGIATISRT